MACVGSPFFGAAIIATASLGFATQSIGQPPAREEVQRHYLSADREALADDLIAHVQTLRERGEYALAAAAADYVLSYRRLFQPEAWWEVRQALHYKESLERIVALPGPQKRRLSELDSMFSRFYRLYKNGQYLEAANVLRQAAEERSEITPWAHYYIVTDLVNASTALQNAGEFAVSESMLRAAVDRARREIGELHPRTAMAIHNLAVLTRRRGEAVEAQSLYAEALAIRRQILKPGHRDIAQSLLGLGAALFDQGRFEEARAPLNEGAKVLSSQDEEGRWSPSSALLAKFLANLARVEHEMGRFEEAITLHEEALRVRIDALGPDHTDVAASHESIGDLAFDQKRFERAREAFDTALMIRSAKSAVSQESALRISLLAKRGRTARALGSLEEAEQLLREALDLASEQRIAVVGDERERAAYGDRLGLDTLAANLAILLIEKGNVDDALTASEMGRGRALLDLLARAELDLFSEALAGEDPVSVERLETRLKSARVARTGVASAEARIPTLRKERSAIEQDALLVDDERSHRLAELDQLIAEAVDVVKEKRRVLAEASAGVLAELRGLFPAAEPMSAHSVLAALAPGEFVLNFLWTDEDVAVLAAGDANVSGALLVDGEDQVDALRERVDAFRTVLTDRSSTAFDTATARALLEDLLPPDLWARAAKADRLIIVPDGPLHGIPFEPLLRVSGGLAGLPVVYAASATMYLDRKRAGKVKRSADGSALRLTVVGDPIFDRGDDEPATYPDAGVVITSVAVDTNAAEAGLRRGDVIRSYAGAETTNFESLADAISEVNKAVEAGERDPGNRDVSVSIWRNGETFEVALAPGRIGVNLSQSPPDEILRSMAFFDRGLAAVEAEATAVDQVRLFGDSLRRLLGSAREARALAAIAEQSGGEVTLLLREDAAIGHLSNAADGAHILHLATHGLTGNSARPYEASLALTQPETPAPDDIGFLRLEDLIRSWRGKLADCRLVVLSACDTQRGVLRGDAMMSLPWGFFYAGAPTVVASLWKVDDTATSLLMQRFYENLLGVHDDARSIHNRSYDADEPLPTLDALDEAKQWLRLLTTADRNRLLGADVGAIADEAARGSPSPRRGPLTRSDAEDARPYAHPYYWAAFVLYGSGG